MTFIKVGGTMFQLEHVCNAEYRKINPQDTNMLELRSNKKEGSILYVWLTNGHEIRLLNEFADYVWERMNTYLDIIVAE